jgi:hypothetical protein
MAKLIFVLGPAAAGKTTLARSLAAKRKIAFFDMDTLLRPAAEAIMTLAGQDPTDRDSPFYKEHCRDLGYRITMDAALDNIALGCDAVVVGPFTREVEEDGWLGQELARISATPEEDDVEVKVLYVYLPDEEMYRQRLLERGSALDRWKLDHWEQFRPSLARREVHWPLPAESILYLDNAGPSSAEKLASVEHFVYSAK